MLVPIVILHKVNKMPPKSNQNDLKSAIRESVKELLDNEDFINKLLEKISEKIERLEQKVNDYEEKNFKLETKIEILQQNAKLNNICIYGIQEEENEKLNDKILKLFNEKMKVEIEPADIVNSFRIGNKSTKSRPVLVKFDRRSTRNAVLKNCGILRGTKIAITEDLLKSRLKLLREAQDLFDRKHVRTYEGNIYVIINQKKYIIHNSNDLKVLTDG